MIPAKTEDIRSHIKCMALRLLLPQEVLPRWNPDGTKQFWIWNYFGIFIWSLAVDCGVLNWKPNGINELCPGSPTSHAFYTNFKASSVAISESHSNCRHPRRVHLINWKITKTNLISGNYHAVYPSAVKKKIYRIKAHFYHLRLAPPLCLCPEIVNTHLWKQQRHHMLQVTWF